MNKYCLVSLLFPFLFACNSNTQKSEDGETLSQIHCASCHAYPEPNLLDKNSWDKYILPRMGHLLGVLPEDSVGVDFIEPSAKEVAFRNPNIIREEASLSKNEWLAIREFYLKNAPENPIPISKPKIEKPLPGFEVKYPPHFLSPPSSTMVMFSGYSLFLGDFHTGQLYGFDENLDLKSNANLPPGVVSMTSIEEGYVVTSMGSFTPTDKPSGQVTFLPLDKRTGARKLVENLRRPVHTELSDLDGDGRFDLIISEFAKWTGSLCWWKNGGNGNFERHVLRNMPGAIRTIARDLNGDNLPDIMALFAQGDEGIFIFWNEGNGEFREERLLRFPPSYGSSYFDLFDYDGDEHPDIIYTNGDNADFPPIEKAYHGIRIFQNDGSNQFREVFHYPLLGAYKAIPADFDQDGNLDIAAIAFFPDFAGRPEGSFVLLKGKKKVPKSADDFTTHTFPECTSGRWLVMDAGDLEGDGDLDLVLGSLAFEVVPDGGEVENWKKNGIPFLILENTLK